MNNSFEVKVTKIDMGYIVLLEINYDNYFNKIIYSNKYMAKQLEMNQFDVINLLTKYNAKYYKTKRDIHYYFESIDDASSFKNYIEDLYTQKQVLKNLIKQKGVKSNFL